MQQLESDVAPNATVTHPPWVPTGQILSYCWSVMLDAHRGASS
jgi:hypothetical protein